jgi:acetyl-CoA synthetase
VPLKNNVDAAVAKAGGVDWVVVVKHTGTPVNMDPGRDFWYREAAEVVRPNAPASR